MNSKIMLKAHQRSSEIFTLKYETFPAVKIARLAIDQELQGSGYGKTLVEWTITLIRDKISPAVGGRFLEVDAKQDSISFYEKTGFCLFDKETNDEHPLMFLDLYYMK